MNVDFGNKKLDFMENGKREKILRTLLKNQIKYVYNTTRSYQEQYDKRGIDPKQINAIDDLNKLPILTKEKIRSMNDHYGPLPHKYKKALVTSQININPYGSRLHKMFSTSGTTGKPTNVFYTENDWKILGDLVKRVYQDVPIDKYSVLFNAVHAGHIGGQMTDQFQRAGFTVIRKHFRANDEQALTQIKNFGCNVLVSVPHAVGKGGGTDDLVKSDTEGLIGDQIKVVISGGAAMKDELRRLLIDLGVEYIIEDYASSELLHMAAECEFQTGLHILFGPSLVEIVDLKSGEHVASEERGRIVLTVLDREGSQFIRYDLGDEATFIDEPCECGRTTPRIKDIKRVEDLERLETGCRVWE